MEEKQTRERIAPWRRIVRILLFSGILLGLILLVSRPLINPGDARSYRNVVGFYELEPDTCDVVCIGSSRTYAFWTPLFAYDRHGIRMFSFATPGQPLEAARYIVEEVLKTQPHAAVVVNLDDVKDNKTERFHQLLDYFPFSATKLRLIRTLCEKKGIPAVDRLEYVFPVIRYHSRWKELSKSDFWKDTDGMMGSSYFPDFLTGVEDEKASFYEEAEEIAEIDDYTRGVIGELVGYCDAHGVKLLLTMAPQAQIIPETLAYRAAMSEYARSIGATVLDMQYETEKIGIDPARDYYNAAHTNIHGSAKYTAYVSDWIMENWGLKDRRGAEGSAKWEDGLNKYRPIVEPAMLPFEWQPEKRADLPQPGFTVDLSADGGAVVRFDPVDGADGYEIFRRKSPSKPWVSLSGQTEAGEYADAGGKEGYAYLVAAFIEKDDGRCYGTVDYAGKTAKAAAVS